MYRLNDGTTLRGVDARLDESMRRHGVEVRSNGWAYTLITVGVRAGGSRPADERLVRIDLRLFSRFLAEWRAEEVIEGWWIEELTLRDYQSWFEQLRAAPVSSTSSPR